jgi:hypothetical protein
MRRAFAVVLLVSAAASAAASPVAGQTAVNPQAAAIVDFQQRLNGYLKLREELSRRLKPLSPTANAAELAARQEALAATLRAARKSARQGDLIVPAVAAQIAETVADDVHLRDAGIKRATFQEVPNAPRPVINRLYPTDSALPTVPPLLLRKLPQLPDNLQYRFFGRHIVLLDGDTQIIVDYIPDVLPPH